MERFLCKSKYQMFSYGIWYLNQRKIAFVRCLAKYGLGHAEEHESVKLLEEEYSVGQNVTLNDCLELHTKEEEVDYC